MCPSPKRRAPWQHPRASLPFLLALTLGLVACGGSDPAADGNEPTDDGGPGQLVEPLAPDGVHFGKTYAEWGATWWKWTFELPLTRHPIYDATGEDCGVGQSGEVFFLTGTFGGTAERRCTVPAGKALLIPVVNQEVDNVGVDKKMQLDDAGLSQAAQQSIDSVVDNGVAFAELDGQAFMDLASYRGGPAKFSYTVPEDSIYQAFGVEVAAGTVVDTAYSDGIWLLLPPLPAGRHTLHFGGGRDTNPNPFMVELTYVLDVEG